MSKSTRPSARLSRDDLVRFHRHVLKTASCHIWLGAVGSDGYGKFSIRNKLDGERVISPQQVSARLAFGPMPLGSTLMHDCDVRVCVSTVPGHVRVSTQGENMRQAARRGRAVGPRPGNVDTRGKVGASRAIQVALRDHLAAHPAADPDDLAAVLAACLAEGDPLRGIVALFEPPAARSVLLPDDFPIDLLDLIARAPAMPTVRRVESVPLFEVSRGLLHGSAVQAVRPHSVAHREDEEHDREEHGEATVPADDVHHRSRDHHDGEDRVRGPRA